MADYAVSLVMHSSYFHAQLGLHGRFLFQRGRHCLGAAFSFFDNLMLLTFRSNGFIALSTLFIGTSFRIYCGAGWPSVFHIFLGRLWHLAPRHLRRFDFSHARLIPLRRLLSLHIGVGWAFGF